MLNTDCIQKIYNQISEQESRRIFTDRLNYSLTGDISFLWRMVDRTVRSKSAWLDLYSHLAKLSEENELVIFGAGIWGRILYQETKHRVQWKGIIDSNSKVQNLENIPVIAFDKFIREYKGEIIAISSFKMGEEMAAQLHSYGILDDKIIDAGKVIYELTEKSIYFDLKELLPLQEKEVFVDAGCFDGLSTKAFFAWSKERGYSYCLEPDRKNIERIQYNLRECHNYEVVPKALWSETMSLSIRAKGNFASSVVKCDVLDESTKIEAVALDDFLYDEAVSFIKMDIEGAELEALRGARHIIEEKKPRLAISIYHKAEDIWTIPNEILKYDKNYRFYLRHYSFSDYDTVLYAIP